MKSNSTTANLRFSISILYGVFVLTILACGTVSNDYVGDDVYHDLSPVCSGEGIPEAKGFDPDAEIHPTIVMTMSGEYWKSRYGLGDGWTPTSVSETQIVICIGEETSRSVVICGYEFTGLATRRAWIRDAKTGEVYIFRDLVKKVECNGQTYREYELSAIEEILISRIPAMEEWYRSKHSE